MKCNLSFLDRLFRFIIGILLSTWAFIGGPTWAFVGLYLLFTSGWGFCLLYGIFKINTIKELKTSSSLMNPPSGEEG